MNETHLNMRNSWSISESPWNRGLRVAISANIQPKDQISIGQLYRELPSKTSGARYHNVTTSCVYTRTGTPNALPNPKSATYIQELTLHLLLLH